mgnify:CR=1 FL=1
MLQVVMKLSLVPIAAIAALMSVPTPQQSDLDKVGDLTQSCQTAVDSSPTAEIALSRAHTLGSLKYPSSEMENFMFLCMVYVRSRVDAGYYEETTSA